MNKMKNVLLTISAFVVTLPAAAFAYWGGTGGAYGPGWCGMPGGGLFGGGIFMLIFNVLLIALAVFLAVKFFRKGSFAGADNETPLDILKKRLAKGEISKEEFEDLKKVL